MTYFSPEPAFAASSVVADTSPIERPLPVPSEAKINAAAQELSKIDWEIARQHYDKTRVTAHGRGIDHLVMASLPPTAGTSMDYARKIIVLALIKKAEALTPEMIEQIGANVQPEEPELLVSAKGTWMVIASPRASWLGLRSAPRPAKGNAAGTDCVNRAVNCGAHSPHRTDQNADFTAKRGRSSEVERQLPKLNVASSILAARSIFQ
jgi:hypothetical protein